MIHAKRIQLVIGVLMIASLLLAACQPQEVVRTVVVTQVVEREGQTVIETQIVEVTPTPPPAEPMASAPVISPEFNDPETFFVVTGAGEQETMDPAWMYDTASSSLATNIYEGLVFFNRERTDEYVPALATEWEVDDSGTVWTFQIRDGVSFHQGGTLEPHDVAYSLQRGMLQGRIDGPHWINYEAFFGPELARSSVKDFAAALVGKDSYEELSSAELQQVCEDVKAAVVADDEAGTVTYTLHAPTPWFFALLSSSFTGYVLDQEWMVENGDWDGDCATWQDFADPSAEDSILFNQTNGTGPYMLDHWTPGEETVLTAFEDYWRTEPMWEGGPSGVASLKRVVIKNVDEWGTRLAMFEAGDADYIYVDPQFYSQIEEQYRFSCNAAEECTEDNPQGYITAFRSLPRPAITPAQLNWQINVEGGNPFIGSGELDGNGIPPDFFSDIHIRKALNYCFDFDAMINDALAGEGVQAQGPIPAGMLGYREGEDPLYSYDPARCEEEFKLADVDKDGIPAGEDTDDIWNRGFYFQMAYNTGNETRRLTSEIFKAGLESINPSFNVGVIGMPWPVLLDSRRSGKLPIYVGGWLEDYHDPHNWVHAFLHSQGAYGRIVNMTPEIAQEFDDLILQGATVNGVEQRRPIYEEIQLKAQEQAVNVWEYQALARYHFQNWVKGFYYNSAYSTPAYSWIYALSKEAP